MTIHDKDKILITKAVMPGQGQCLLLRGQIVWARGTTTAMYEGKPDNLPVYYRDKSGDLQMGQVKADSYELIELKYIPLYRLLYEV